MAPLEDLTPDSLWNEQPPSQDCKRAGVPLLSGSPSEQELQLGNLGG